MKERIRHIASVGLLVLFLAHLAGSFAFPHKHIIDGEKLVHSHPYTNSDHSHTTAQAIAIAQLSSIQTLKAEIHFCQEVKHPVLYTLDFATETVSIQTHFTHCIGLRAPPAC